MNREPILFYDSDWNGHHLEFLLHLIDFLERTLDESINHQVFFLLNSELKPYFEKPTKHCQIFYLSAIELSNSKSTFHPLLRGVKEWNVVEAFMKEHEIKQVFLMYIDLYLLKIGLMKSQNIRIKGIQFLPYFRMPKQTFRQRLRRQWHAAKMKWAVRNKYLETVFILNDNYSVAELNKLKWHQGIFKYLPDPINELQGEKDDFVLPTLSKDSFKLLVLGHISPRKNLANIIEALNLIDFDIKQKLELLIVGEVDGGYKISFNDLIRSFLQRNPDFLITKIERFVSINEMNTVIEQSDCLLIPYTNSYKSSGIIGLAAKHEKLLIGPNTGIMNDLINDYSLGITVNPYDVESIKQAILEIRKFEITNAKFNEYIEERTPVEFAKIINNCFLIREL